jgi:AAA domain, putative AbiEii toxin, Type IV TA system
VPRQVVDHRRTRKTRGVLGVAFYGMLPGGSKEGMLLGSLDLADVGPAPRIRVELGPRLNVFAGDNGLGKSFVLEVLWWALTGTWAELPAWPRATGATPEIAVELDRRAAEGMSPKLTGRDGVQITGDMIRFQSSFDFDKQEWKNLPLHFTESPLPAMVILARADGSFAVWDPARNHYKLRPGGRWGLLDTEVDANPTLLRRPPSYKFEAKELWNGLEDHGKVLCNGLIRDWVSWQQKALPSGAEESEFELLRRILAQLSPHPDRPNEILRPGPPVRIFVDDTRDFPTIDSGYGPVPVLHASAGMRRILGLAYLIVWSWREHLAASRLLRRPPVNNIVFMMDEVENHLHPTWQRRIFPALFTVLSGLAPSMQVQALLTTHAPLVLASLEPLFDPEQDRFFLFDLDADTGTVTLDEAPWAKQGDAVDWLTSLAFKLDQARSVEAERAIEDAEAFMRGSEPSAFKTRAAIDAELHRVLGGDDPFWARWIGSGAEQAS